MPVGRIAGRNGSDRIDLQIKFSFTVTPVPLRDNGVNSPARLHRPGSLKRAGSRLIPTNLPKSCSINITAVQRFSSLATELRTPRRVYRIGAENISVYKLLLILGKLFAYRSTITPRSFARGKNRKPGMR